MQAYTICFIHLCRSFFHFRYSTSLKYAPPTCSSPNRLRNFTMGLHKNYLKVGQNASNQIFGIPRVPRGSTPLSMLISYGAKFNSSKCSLCKSTASWLWPVDNRTQPCHKHFVCYFWVSLRSCLERVRISQIRNEDIAWPERLTEGNLRKKRIHTHYSTLTNISPAIFTLVRWNHLTDGGFIDTHSFSTFLMASSSRTCAMQCLLHSLKHTLPCDERFQFTNNPVNCHLS